MRVMQPVDPKDIESGAYVFDGGKMLVTTCDGEKVNVAAATYGGVGQLWGKRVIYVYVRSSRYTRELIDKSLEFSLSFLDNKEYRGALKYIEMVSGRDEDKLKGARLTVNYHDGIPYIDESSNVLICRVIYRQEVEKECILDDSIVDEFYKDGNYHVMYIGELEKVLVR